MNSDDTKLVTVSMSSFERRYIFQSTLGKIRLSPEWTESAEFPPLSPRRAQSAALLVAKRMRPDVQDWRLDSISLKETFDGRRMYLVRFWRGDVNYGAIVPYLDIPVLMDGSAIEGLTRDQAK
jgi:hypothetical protein